MDTKNKTNNNRVIIGDSPLMSYIRAILVILRNWLEVGAEGMFGVVVRARGAKTSFAVDVANVAIREPLAKKLYRGGLKWSKEKAPKGFWTSVVELVLFEVAVEVKKPETAIEVTISVGKKHTENYLGAILYRMSLNGNGKEKALIVLRARGKNIHTAVQAANSAVDDMPGYFFKRAGGVWYEEIEPQTNKPVSVAEIWILNDPPVIASPA